MNKNQNAATLVGHYGGDKTHALAAWSSTYLELGIELPEKIEDRVDVIVDDILSKSKKMRSIDGLLTYLSEHRHTSPFEFSTLHFVITEDYKSHLHSIKHRIGHSKNTESSRYKERVQDKFYLPKDWKSIEFDKMRSNLVSNFSHEIYLPDGALGSIIWESRGDWHNILMKYTEIGNILYHEAIEQLTPHLGKSRAKESAAYFLTLNNQVNANDMWNFSSFMHFQRLRNSPNAQKEIRDLADMMLQEVKSIPDNPFMYSLKAFGYE